MSKLEQILILDPPTDLKFKGKASARPTRNWHPIGRIFLKKYTTDLTLPPPVPAAMFEARELGQLRIPGLEWRRYAAQHSPYFG